jgi:hypothetical protein
MEINTFLYSSELSYKSIASAIAPNISLLPPTTKGINPLLMQSPTLVVNLQCSYVSVGFSSGGELSTYI